MNEGEEGVHFQTEIGRPSNKGGSKLVIKHLVGTSDFVMVAHVPDSTIHR